MTSCPLKPTFICPATERIKREGRCLFCILNGVEEFGPANPELYSEQSGIWQDFDYSLHDSTVRTSCPELRTVSEQLGGEGCLQ
jgi:hypothetical protein